ncbi:low-density lipoprotein receptor-like isoform X1 [Portunus trituberculatus]|uniref:low-density lipoprotein receptor-like isoform X1 n=1 Tax=Portunus trituberculatus TaxID=210409 RepID=UPI001E1CB20F|nr:low-density lipoprotein receptor-like isoform X1 [Portunus trituberculatus]
MGATDGGGVMERVEGERERAGRTERRTRKEGIRRNAPGSPRLCHDGYFQCGEGLCIPDALVCDGELNCIAGNDEENCAQGKARNCFPGYFQCAIGNCIPDSLVCNGELNCVTGNDEAFC